MFDLGIAEILFIMIAGLLVVGPKEIPAMMQGVGRLFRRLQYIRYAFSQQFEDFMSASELGDVADQVNFEASSKQNAEDDPDTAGFDEEGEDEAYFEMSVEEGRDEPKASKSG